MFSGTGGLLYACSHYGALTMGCDIDGRQLRGTTKHKTRAENGIRTNIEQYNLQKWILDLLVFDITKAPLRSVNTGIFDAIVTDPPYGVRAGARKIGRDIGRSIADDERGKRFPQTGMSHTQVVKKAYVK